MVFDTSWTDAIDPAIAKLPVRKKEISNTAELPTNLQLSVFTILRTFVSIFTC
jgi:hypothetical protein